MDKLNSFSLLAEPVILLESAVTATVNSVLLETV